MLVASWESWTQAKRTAIEYLAVFIASAGFVFGMLGLLKGSPLHRSAVRVLQRLNRGVSVESHPQTLADPLLRLH